MKGIRYIIPMISILFLVVLVIVYFVGFVYDTKREGGIDIAGDVAQLISIFDKINKDCTILSFDYQKNPINFLNVTKFVGSEVASMNLAYPEKWQGPYVEDNPQIQGKEYQVVKTKQGYFIVPGEGVELPSGKVVGKDIILNEDADIFSMMGNEDIFLFRGKTLAAPLNIGSQKVQMPVRLQP